MMLVALYTSRIVLNTLGVEDYGIYNVVGGIVAMFGFLNSSMSTTTMRYITYELGKGNFERLKVVFNTCQLILGIISVLVVVGAETVGVWFLYNKMQIPVDRMDAAFWVFQCSILAFNFDIWYLKLVEKVSFYALIDSNSHFIPHLTCQLSKLLLDDRDK